MGIVDEIIVAIKALLPGLTGFTQLDYEYDVALNAEDRQAKKFGFIPKEADFIEGRGMGFTTVDHTFQMILTDDFKNFDDDTTQHTKLMALYTTSQNAQVEFQKSRLALPTPGHLVMLISLSGIEEPEFLGENNIVILRTNFKIQYKYRNN